MIFIHNAVRFSLTADAHEQKPEEIYIWSKREFVDGEGRGGRDREIEKAEKMRAGDGERAGENGARDRRRERGERGRKRGERRGKQKGGGEKRKRIGGREGEREGTARGEEMILYCSRNLHSIFRNPC